MGSPENAFKLLITTNELEAQNLAHILEEGNRERQRVETSAFEEALEQIEKNELGSHQVIVLDSPDWHEGVLGIVASRVVDRYQKPSIVISRRGAMGKGSGRSVPSFSLFESVLKCENLLEAFGGHAQACGLSIKAENIPLFRQRLNEVVSERLEPLVVDLELAIDAEIALDEITPKFLQDLEGLAPFGPGNKMPRFVSRKVSLKGPVKKRGKDTLQSWITDETGRTTCEMIGFRKFNRWIESKTSGLMDIVHQPSLKDFNGILSIQLELEDWCLAFSKSS
jgi:single-stranded-DNA-specific exonuclease